MEVLSWIGAAFQTVVLESWKSWESFPETSLKELDERLPKKVQAALNNSGKKKKKVNKLATTR